MPITVHTCFYLYVYLLVFIHSALCSIVRIMNLAMRKMFGMILL
jgi:hypothetical protein